jgi:hypothetical protein
MIYPKVLCANYNHGKSVVTINFCPGCGQKFKSSIPNSCNDEIHRKQRKQRSLYCTSCGKILG